MYSLVVTQTWVSSGLFRQSLNFTGECEIMKSYLLYKRVKHSKVCRIKFITRELHIGCILGLHILGLFK